MNHTGEIINDLDLLQRPPIELGVRRETGYSGDAFVRILHVLTGHFPKAIGPWDTLFQREPDCHVIQLLDRLGDFLHPPLLPRDGLKTDQLVHDRGQCVDIRPADPERRIKRLDVADMSDLQNLRPTRRLNTDWGRRERNACRRDTLHKRTPIHFPPCHEDSPLCGNPRTAG